MSLIQTEYGEIRDRMRPGDVTAFSGKKPFAYKGGKIGSRIKGEIVSKIANSKLRRGIMVGVFGITIVCLGLGCGGGNNITSPVAAESTEEVGDIANSYEGDNIYFEVDGIFYEGLVTTHVSADEIHVLLDNGNKMVIGIGQVGGRLITDHPDIGVEVVLDGDQDGEVLQYGSIIAGYGNGRRKIEIDKVKLVDGEIADLDLHRIRYVHEDKSFIEEGGYLTLEEFNEFMIGLE